MMTINRWSMGLFLLLLVGGCGEGTAPKTVIVTGTVKYQGSPVESGRITFQPQELNDGRPAVGMIQAGGTYDLSTYTAGDGAKPGNYKVLIESYEGGATPENPRARKEWLVPEKYSSPQSSDLTATIPQNASGSMELNFNLE